MLRSAGTVIIVTIILASLTSRPGAQPHASRRHMVFIPAGTFKMGTETAQLGRLAPLYGVKHTEIFEAESPAHTVTLSAFYIDKFEVTNKDFAKFLKAEPKWRRGQIAAGYDNGNYLKDWLNDKYASNTADLPVTNVNWYAAMAYCHSVGKRLPTEAEWEYAARGGLADAEFPWGKDPADPKLANYGKSGFGKPVKVGSYEPNGYGLYDMAGNVWEFTADEWGKYSVANVTDPLAGPNIFSTLDFDLTTTRRVIRGGSWGGSPINLRVAYRDNHPPNGSQPFVGFRCVLPS